MDNHELRNLVRKIDHYKEIRQNTEEYRTIWKKELKAFIFDSLTKIVEMTGFEANIELRENLENLESIILDIGRSESGIFELMGNDTRRPLIRNNGMLIYQQIFNGKIQVMFTYPYIEGFGTPRQPNVIAIYRPEELKEPFLVRHIEEFIKAVTDWEDFDDEEPSPIGFNMSFTTPTETDGND